MEKKYVIMLMDAYVKDVKKEFEVSDFLDSHGIVFSIDQDDMAHACEAILEDVLPGSVSYLLGLVEDGKVSADSEEITTCEALYDFLIEGDDPVEQ